MIQPSPTLPPHAQRIRARRILDDAWNATRGVRRIYLGWAALGFLASMAVAFIGDVLPSLVALLLVAAYAAFVTLAATSIALEQVRDRTPTFGTPFGYLHRLPAIALLTIQGFLVVTALAAFAPAVGAAGFSIVNAALTVVIYGFASLLLILAPFLVLDRGYGAARAIAGSIRLCLPHVLTILAMNILLGIITFVSSIPMGIGLLWTGPMAFLAPALLYLRASEANPDA